MENSYKNKTRHEKIRNYLKHKAISQKNRSQNAKWFVYTEIIQEYRRAITLLDWILMERRRQVDLREDGLKAQ